ncbi:MAG: carbon starvation protein A [Planctomycetota bacterium]
MATLLIALGAGVAFLVAYHTYGRWLGRRVFNLAADAVCPSAKLRDDQDYVPTSKAIVFGHHFTSIAGTGPIVGPAIAVMWGWLPALLWVVLGSIFIGAVHDFGSLVVSLRNNGQTVGDIAGRVINKRVRLLFLFVLFLALTIVLAIFGLVIAAVFKQYPAAITPCLIQIPIAVGIGVYLHRRGKNLLLPSLLALGVMYLTVMFGDVGFLGEFNAYLAELSIITWVVILLLYSYVASVLPVWSLLQPRDYINSLQLLTALGLIVLGLFVAAFIGGTPPVEGADRQPLEIVAPMVNPNPEGAPPIYPFLFITIACGAISGFHCLVSSGTSSKQLKKETDAQFVGYGSMVTEGFLATLVILCCVAGLGLGISGFTAGPSVVRDTGPLFNGFISGSGSGRQTLHWDDTSTSSQHSKSLFIGNQKEYQNNPLNQTWYEATAVSELAWEIRYQSWASSGGLSNTVAAFVDGSANFLTSLNIPSGIAVALMGVLVASFAGTTLDTACRLQRYVVQELAGTFFRRPGAGDCVACGYDLTGNTTGECPECGHASERLAGDAQRPAMGDDRAAQARGPAGRPLNVSGWHPLSWLTNKHGATIFAIVIAALMAAMPTPGNEWSLENAGKGGLILWPMFGATNQLLGGLAFLVITFWLWRRGKPIWFVALPLVFMLIMPAWAMLIQIPDWLDADQVNWALVGIAVATIALELWMIVEAALLFPKIRNVAEASAD